MRRTIPLLILITVLFFNSCKKAPLPFDYLIKPVNFSYVTLTDNFMQTRVDTNRINTITYAFEMCRKTGRIENFEIAGGIKKGKFCSKYPFDDSDVYKIIEGASYTLADNYNKELDQFLDSLIQKIAMAQQKDGYLETWRAIDPNSPLADWWGSAARWSGLQGGHELYNLGHLYEAAVAHYQATGKRSLLEIALKSADLITRVFGPGKKIGVPGHEEVEIGLMKLYRVTEDQKYLNLAKFFIDERGDSTNRKIWGEYQQDHMPVKNQREAVGHAVRAGYLYSAMADLTALTGDTTYLPALEAIWNDIVKHKLYITGGVGSKSDGEAFGKPYELPNASAYAETCAAISMVLWNHRMFLLTGNSKYYDFLEETLYNGLLSGIGLNGENFFYQNPLEYDGVNAFNEGTTSRQPWFSCACCPSNLARFIPQIPGLIYAVTDNLIYINLYISNKAIIQVHNYKVHLQMTSGYPWNGDSNIKINVSGTKDLIFGFRVPSWVKGNTVDNDLYHIINYNTGSFEINVNNKPIVYSMKNGYALISRKWAQGDIINVHFTIKPDLVQSNDSVADDKNKIAVELGPLLYCAEGQDNGPDFKELYIDNKSQLNPMEDYKMGMHFKKIEIDHPDLTKLILIPYSLWANRGLAPMKVWIKYTSR